MRLDWSVSQDSSVKDIIQIFLTHQWRLTQQFTASHQVADGDMKVGVPATPVRDFGEWVSH